MTIKDRVAHGQNVIAHRGRGRFAVMAQDRLGDRRMTVLENQRRITGRRQRIAERNQPPPDADHRFAQKSIARPAVDQAVKAVIAVIINKNLAAFCSLRTGFRGGAKIRFIERALVLRAQPGADRFKLGQNREGLRDLPGRQTSDDRAAMRSRKGQS
nr:hypothetical protein [Jiella flava]